MPEIIVDTSPLQYLYQIAQLDLLPTLYGHIKIPQAVATELSEGLAQGLSLPDLASLSWITCCPVPPSMMISNVPKLGAGEQEALSLAITIPDSLVIVDDALARRYAQQLNIPITGTLGVLLKGKQLGHITTIAPLLDELNGLGFRLSPQTHVAVLKLAGE